jgi:cardiolipin synthase A/B
MSHTVVHVAVPVTRTKTHLKIFKGRPWSVVEHLILEALASAARTLGDLERGFILPRQIVTASLMRLMRAQWVQIHSSSDGPTSFLATRSGREAASKEDLPYNPIVLKTHRSHLYERLTGHVFRLDELRHFSRGTAIRAGAGEQIVEINEGILPDGCYRVDEVEAAILEEGEEAAGILPGAEHYSDNVGLFTVIDDKIINWPVERELGDLETRILRAARAVLGQPDRLAIKPAIEEEEPQRTNAILPVNIFFQPKDLIIGAEPHLEAIRHALNTAQSRVIIHSTFLRLEAINST